MTNIPTPTTGPTCQKSISNGSWSVRYDPCGKPAKWRLTETKVPICPGQTETRVTNLCGLHGSMAKRSRWNRENRKVEPIAEHGCPLCATETTGADGSRLCPAQGCCWSEAVWIQANINRAVYEAEVAARAATRPFDASAVSSAIEKAEQALRNMRWGIANWPARHGTPEEAENARLAVLEAFAEFQRVAPTMLPKTGGSV